MKLMVLFTLCVSLVAYTTAKSASSNLRIDIYKNILKETSRRVVGGEDAKRRQFPYQAQLLWSFGSEPGMHQCGATLIAKRWVLTAAHCKEPSGNYQIRLGQLNQDEDNAEVQVFKVVNFITHKGYPGGNVVSPNDIAVIELDRDAELTDAVKIAPLANEEQCDDISNSILSGWGDRENWDTPETLQWVTIPRITNKQCANALKSILGTSKLDDTMICIGANPGKHQGACNGDSGGPLVLEKDGALTGVVSWGVSPCGTEGAPSVFTRVCSHREFIDQHVKQ